MFPKSNDQLSDGGILPFPTLLRFLDGFNRDVDLSILLIDCLKQIDEILLSRNISVTLFPRPSTECGGFPFQSGCQDSIFINQDFKIRVWPILRFKNLEQGDRKFDLIDLNPIANMLE